MKSRDAVRTNRPLKGQVAFARAVAMGSLGICGAVSHPVHPVHPAALAQLDRNEDPMHPGEGSA